VSAPASTFKDAQEAALAHARAEGWRAPGGGTWAASDEGQEDAWFWRVRLGAEEWLLGGDQAYATADEPIILVDKKTSAVTVTDWYAAGERLADMTPAGRPTLVPGASKPLREARERFVRAVGDAVARRAGK
jgi:hypothetical protein